MFQPSLPQRVQVVGDVAVIIYLFILIVIIIFIYFIYFSLFFEKPFILNLGKVQGKESRRFLIGQTLDLSSKMVVLSMWWQISLYSVPL